MEYDAALITGASGGIGCEFAKLLAPRCKTLVLVARNENKLNTVKTELEAKYPVRVKNIVRDLREAGSMEAIYRELEQKSILPDILINNAGFGDHGAFVDRDSRISRDMLAVNIVALTLLTRLFAKDMKARGRGMILNVASTAAFQPGPFMAVYYASKAYVLSFSEALAYELKGSGVTVTALCPGPTVTGFAETASVEETRLFKYRSPSRASDVARYGYEAMVKGKTVAVHGLLNRLGTWSVRIAPRKLMPAIVYWLHGSVKS
jgi:uncharacterized protein